MNALSWSALLTLITTATAFQCKDMQVLNTTTIGAAGEVTAKLVTCGNMPEVRDLASKRQTGAVCGVPCTTNCFTPSGGGPNPYDCQAIVNSLVDPNQNPTFSIPIGNYYWLSHGSCETILVNQANYDLVVCLSDWSGMINNIAFSCQSQQNAHGGNCVPSDQSWYIQVQTYGGL